MDDVRRPSQFSIEDVEPDDELPEYDDAVSAPVYSASGFHDAVFVYNLSQLNRKTQTLAPLGSGAAPSYKIVSRRKWPPFSKKPDRELVRISAIARDEEAAGAIWFVNGGPLPWRPRARVLHRGAGGPEHYAMEAKDFQNWAMTVDDTMIVVQLRGRPVSLTMGEKGSNRMLAHFTFSEHGTRANNGAAVGELALNGNGMWVDQEGLEKLLCALHVALEQFKRMGRHYWNDDGNSALSCARNAAPPRTGAYGSLSYV